MNIPRNSVAPIDNFRGKKKTAHCFYIKKNLISLEDSQEIFSQSELRNFHQKLRITMSNCVAGLLYILFLRVGSKDASFGYLAIIIILDIKTHARQ